MDDIWGLPCPICRNEISTLCVECEATKKTTPENPIVCPSKRCYWSTHHVYHTHCLDRWIKMRNVCPLDNYEWKESPSDILSLKELCIREISNNVPLVLEYYRMVKDDLTVFPPNQVELLAQLVCHPGRRFRETDLLPKPFCNIFGALFSLYIPSWREKEIIERVSSTKSPSS